MSFPIKSDLFLKSIENFLLICENSASDFVRQREKLNNILNELNSFDIKSLQSMELGKVNMKASIITKHVQYNNHLVDSFVRYPRALSESC